MEANEELTILDIALKCRSKKELYSVLTTKGNIYLPPLADCNQNYLRGIWNGSKLYVKWSDVKVIKVPHLEGLRVKKILEFTFEHLDVQQYLPDYEYQKEPNKDWLCNLVHTLLHGEFRRFISTSMSQREAKIIKEKNLGVVARPEIINIFKNSRAVSTSKGKSHFVLRPVAKNNVNIQRRDEEIKIEEDAGVVNELRLKLEEMRSQIDLYEQEKGEAIANKDKLAKLYEKGVIDSDGEYNE